MASEKRTVTGTVTPLWRWAARLTLAASGAAAKRALGDEALGVVGALAWVLAEERLEGVDQLLLDGRLVGRRRARRDRRRGEGQKGRDGPDGGASVHACLAYGAGRRRLTAHLT